MSEKKTSTPKEIPLHEVVLKAMYEVNKEKPAELTIAEVHQEISDDSISEIKISDVLNWLVVQKQVELGSGKYSLDRYEFLEQRARDRGTDKKKKTKEEEEVPLHEIILGLMYESDKEKPAKLTIDDVFWKVSDPKIQKPLVGDVLKWLLNQGRIEFLSGKYSLDRIEFQDQEKVSEKKAAKKKAPEKPKQKKKAPEKKPKIVIPPSTEEVKPKPKQPEKEVKPVEVKKPAPAPVAKKPESVKQPEVKEPTPTPVAEKPEPVKQPDVKEPVVETSSEVVEQPIQQRWRMPFMVISVICVIYTFYLLFALDGSISSYDGRSSSEDVKSELVSAKAKLNEISEKGSSNAKDITFLKERIQSLEEFTKNGPEVIGEDGQTRSLLTRLIVALCVTFFLISFLLFNTRSTRLEGKK